MTSDRKATLRGKFKLRHPLNLCSQLSTGGPPSASRTLKPSGTRGTPSSPTGCKKYPKIDMFVLPLGKIRIFHSVPSGRGI
ncbi:hypothetical protein LENED_009222 [Lentinula edodes]|uniref:Uncharacterized protein n=1 Tax=Lentinula edodes TaxID=5353 RepID=A0A1Q3EJ77_LENED|nr:hypothetical protein HHX47_DHR8000489 [Lentinula edodes]GAW07245.1 hypothetical protein LENED_009222 [Lentinula edodes]